MKLNLVNIILTILILICSILSIIFSLNVLVKKSNFSNIIDECLDKKNEELKVCKLIMRCKNNINCQISGQPANRGLHSSHSVTGNFGDSSVIKDDNVNGNVNGNENRNN